MEKPYKLSACLYGHSLDVRALAVTSIDEILSGSRDKSTKLWRPNGFNASYNEVISYKDQKNFVASVMYLEPTKEYPEGLVITGGNDCQIIIYKPSEPVAVCIIKEHSDTVSCLSKGAHPNSFISGSWDKTAKYWMLNSNSSSQTSLATLRGHLAAIWSVIQLQDTIIVTASADKNISMWDLEGKLLRTLRGHTDCVRGLCDVPDSNYFISVSNDATIRTWTYSGQNIDTLYGHTNYIYSIVRCKTGSNCFVTSDEDHTVRVWRDGVNTQTFQLPAQSVWAVATLSNGDIVTGSSDGVVRVFTQEESRVADPSTLSNFEEEVASLYAQRHQEIGGYKVSDLPGPEALFEPGTRAGQMKMIREASGVVAYTWVSDGNNSHWEKVGDVLGAAKDQGNEGKTMFEGKYYDFVFSVDVEDGKPPLKLPYNTGVDPYKAAQTFLARNALPSVYLEQVVDFILKNSKQQFTPTVSNEYVDPFTGGSRYTPSGNNTSQFQGANVDPFTGGSSYSTGSSAAINIGTSGGNADPFTGGMSYTTSSTKKSTFFPQKQYLAFDVGDPNVILNKLKEFNKKIVGSNDIEERHLEEFVSLCTGFPKNPNVFDILFKLLEWPEDLIFPVLDVVRMAIRHKQNNEVLSTLNSETLLDRLKYFIGEKCTVVNNRIVALRTLSNMCLHPTGEALIFDNRFDIVENVTSLSGLNKNAQIALSTLLLNLAILSENRNDEVGITVLVDVIEDILDKLSDPESQFRTYVALGTLLTSNICNEIKMKLKASPNFLKVLNDHVALCNNETERKRTECAKDVKNLL